MKTRIQITDPERLSPAELTEAAGVIRAGGLVAFPTETVYGLGADGTNEAAVRRIYEAKGRPSNNPLILHFAKPEDTKEYAVCDRRFDLLSEAFMPGPLTVVLPHRGLAAPAVTAGLATVAVRCPIHPVARALISLSGVPIAAPSANLSGKPSPTSFEFVKRDLDGRADMLIDGGDCSVGVESTIVKLTEDGATLLRPGGITLEMLETVLGHVSVSSAVLSPPEPGAVPESPGMLYKHYAPDAPLYLVRAKNKQSLNGFLADASQDSENSVICYTGELEKKNNIYYLGAYGDEAEQARHLFYLLRLADKPGIRRIYAPFPRREGMGLALQNRMLRAAAFRIKDI